MWTVLSPHRSAWWYYCWQLPVYASGVSVAYRFEIQTSAHIGAQTFPRMPCRPLKRETFIAHWPSVVPFASFWPVGFARIVRRSRGRLCFPPSVVLPPHPVPHQPLICGPSFERFLSVLEFVGPTLILIPFVIRLFPGWGFVLTRLPTPPIPNPHMLNALGTPRDVTAKVLGHDQERKNKLRLLQS